MITRFKCSLHIPRLILNIPREGIINMQVGDIIKFEASYFNQIGKEYVNDFDPLILMKVESKLMKFNGNHLTENKVYQLSEELILNLIPCKVRR